MLARNSRSLAIVLAATLTLALAAPVYAQKGSKHAHSHAEYLPAPTTTLEALQQADALVAAMRSSVDGGRLNEIHDLTEMFAIALSGVTRFGGEGLSESKQSRLDGLTKNLRRSADELHHAADDEEVEKVTPALVKLEKLYPLLAGILPEAAKQAKETPLAPELAKKLPGYTAEKAAEQAKAGEAK